MKLITEFIDHDIRCLSEGTGDDRKYYIQGIFMQAEKKNRNNRIYPREILQNAVSRYVAEQVVTGRAVGELNHPDGPTINYKEVSHRITELTWNGNDVIGKALILTDLPNGKIVKGLLDGGVKIGVSSRGMGSIESRGGNTYVKGDFSLATVDIVQDPSAPSAFVEGIMEGYEFFKNGDDIIKQKVESIRKVIHKTPSAQLEQTQIREFERFLTELNVKLK